jgi:folate-binding protein YgfZ
VPYSSPFEPALRERGAVLGRLGEISVPLHFGDASAETRAFRTSAAGVDLPWLGVIEMTGRDRARFLHGMCTNDVKKLQPGESCIAAVVNRQGKMAGVVTVLAAENALLLVTDRAGMPGLVEALLKFVVADPVSIRASEAAVAGVYGPSAPDLLGLGALAERAFVMRENVAVLRDPSLGVPGFQLIVPPSRPDELGRLLAHGIAPAGFEAFEAVRIDNGWPRWGADMGPDLLPMEAGLEPVAISYQKGCYIGQEVIQRVKTYSEPPRMLVQLAFEGVAVPSPGARVTVSGQDAGYVTSAARSPSSGRGVALAIVRKEHQAPGTAVSAEPGLPAAVRALPWQARP